MNELPENERWRVGARCLRQGDDDTNNAFFNSGSSTTARKICAECPVRTPCLEYALEHAIQYGIWGGLSTKQRRKIRHARNAIMGNTRKNHGTCLHPDRKTCGTPSGYTSGCRGDPCFEAMSAYHKQHYQEKKAA